MGALTAVREDRFQCRRPARLYVTRVRRTEQLTPRMVRVTFGSEDLSAFLSNGTDQHVALYFYEPWVDLPRPFTTEAARELLPVARPRLRRYTIRADRPELGEVDMDFVLHGGDQLASGWAARAKPGDESIWYGPSPANPLDPETPWWLLFGDETALPALAASLEQLPPGSRARVFVEVADAEEQLPLYTGSGTEITWLHRNGRPAGSLLHKAVSALSLPPGPGRVWGAAERGVTGALREHFVRGHGIPRDRTRLTPYWTAGHSQDG
ncbi:siderophore-interacting protein [Streptomyces sp. SCSIO ZS0520]|uniref:siderophore-interacting protein n=1 Tax=Streptomyces sp. SCSIO ZS0520 TaxID=2892996 RepID=UPI0021DB5CDF|nr:siderophore-interacting protein [Streptomyces sp. SCSIO ZS0520]